MSTTRIAVVTGAAQGLGRAIALRLADDGLDVVVADLASKSTQLDQIASEITAKGRKALSVITDVTDDEQVKNLVQQAVSVLGGIDVMVANAGICPTAPLLDLNIQEFDQVLSVNLKGVLSCYVHAARAMVAQNRGGRLIGASSCAGKRGAYGSAAYSSSKFGVRALTQTAAIEFAKYDITANAYAPGPIDTPMHTDALEKLKASKEFQSDVTMIDILKAMSFSRPLIERLGTPQEVAGLVSFIASKDSSYITGQTISVDGGMSFD
ncbi:hypothetical protein SERLA73DRAFT_184031 [Serpula lacrymans var. lacrymans S7.3]|uniref:NAD(P)-binding protein n=2 Tax=Serpula lacrymans var. lacrymans TaxID=341189 RepID=F8Q2E3_SERL3|nr:uncharacterized protein SERLADRAFT_471490 [Serpula lacrymans var. lacrymans S7.9]EGN97354.1 hypothetical protein SERLA73DRAFT_184031 [Serpula lacrymans var. lacrymans S7.3]EGO22946.1 hypothetical protein SERLADRAFT_471490 [Serpula lacrymans var. lacrymans S7.9]